MTVTGNDTGFIVSTTGIDQKDCWRLAMIADNVDIASTRINSAAAMVGKISLAQASAACVVGKSNTVTFTLDS
ncbi:type 4 pilus major pilin [Candidatus Regiella insecticola]|uniref:type 4 pilus major pilin n=1 Tax=Candidatus Regiella insecticola TaxID=138073 RepID=UPI0009DAD829|nr:type 4 pilus major pilin [Candidatus Regiella insecticola]